MNTTPNRELSYTASDGTVLKSRLYLPEHTEHKHMPAVLVLPEWWGLSEHVCHSAERLAHSGYAALAVDLYGDAVLTDKAEEAVALMNGLLAVPEKLAERTRLAWEQLCALPETDAERTAAIGFCFGGRVALDMARQGVALNAVASFHGILSTDQPARADTLQAAVLVEYAGDDVFVSEADLAAFRAEMEAAKADYRIDVFPQAKHGFTNPEADDNGTRNGVDLAYNSEAATESWVNMLAFFAEKV